jgi:hypothetical protein
MTLMAGTALAQADKPAEHIAFYRLDFVVKENEGGKTINSRSYSMQVSTDPHAGTYSAIRTGSRVPVPAKDGGFSYLDLGMNFDCRSAKVEADQISLNISVDVSSLAEPSSTPPVIRSTKWGSMVTVPLRKPTIVFSSDDALSKRQMQLELTATLIR